MRRGYGWRRGWWAGLVGMAPGLLCGQTRKSVPAPPLAVQCHASESSVALGTPVFLYVEVVGYTAAEAAADVEVSADVKTTALQSGVLAFQPLAPGDVPVHLTVTMLDGSKRVGHCAVPVRVGAFEPEPQPQSTPTAPAGGGVPLPGPPRPGVGATGPGKTAGMGGGGSATRQRCVERTADAPTGGLRTPVTGCVAVNGLGVAVPGSGRLLSARLAGVTSGALPRPSPLQQFPWPPPLPTSRVVVPLRLGGPGLATLGDVDNRLLGALRATGYVECAHYRLGSDTSGYAVITHVEGINATGMALPAQYRFSGQLPPANSLSTYFQQLFTAAPGFYRVIVFVLTDAPVVTGTQHLMEADATRLLQTGPPLLPVSLMQQAVSADAVLTALVYEYKQTDAAEPAYPNPVPVATAQQHLQSAGLWQQLSQP